MAANCFCRAFTRYCLRHDGDYELDYGSAYHIMRNGGTESVDHMAAQMLSKVVKERQDD